MPKSLALSEQDLNETENELTQEMGSSDGGLVNMSLFDLSKIAGLETIKITYLHKRTNFPEAYKKGRYMKAISVLSNRSPNLFIEPSWQRYIQVESFTPDPRMTLTNGGILMLLIYPKPLILLGKKLSLLTLLF